jgi:protein-S-isoprenylcysteine O-methyltransferase Ste14
MAPFVIMVTSMAAAPPGCLPPRLDFEIAQTAGFYSQLAGVLSGFAFAALLFLVTSSGQWATRDDDLKLTLRLVVAVFVSLVLTSLSYAMLAGDTANGGRAASIQLVVASGFISAGVALLLLVYRVLDDLEAARVVPSEVGASTLGSLRFLLAHALPVILIGTLLGGIGDYSDIHFACRPGFLLSRPELELVGRLCVVAVVVLPLFAYVDGFRYLSSRRTILAIQWLARSAVGLGGLATALGFVLSAVLAPEETVPEWAIVPAVVTPTVFLLCVSVHMIRTRWRYVDRT